MFSDDIKYLIMLLKNCWDYNLNETILGIKLLTLTDKAQTIVIIYTNKGNMKVLSYDGELILSEKISENEPIWAIEIFDIDNDGILEIIFASMDGILRVYKLKDLKFLEYYWSHKFSSSVSGILATDINNNGKSEVIGYSLDKSLRVLDPTNGNLIWGQVFSNGIEDAIIMAENESNKLMQIIACGNDGTIRSFASKNGDLIWFKQFSDKIRFINYLKSEKGLLIVCGGDDHELHFIDYKSKKEILTIEFDNTVWKCLAFPRALKNSLLVSSYSFEYLEHSKPIQEFNFSSKLICIDQNLEFVWQLKNKNVEVIHRFQIGTERLVAIGTTQGELLILNEKSGTIRFNNIYNSSINEIQYEPVNKMLIIGYEDGLIKANHIADN